MSARRFFRWFSLLYAGIAVTSLWLVPSMTRAADGSNDPQGNSALTAPDPNYSDSGDLGQFSAPPLPHGDRLAPHAAISILVLGDSIAFGQGASDPRLGFAFELYRQTLIKRPGSSISNRAIPGARLADVTRLELSAPPGKADIVIIEVGSNDVIREANPQAISNAMRTLLHTVKAMFPHAPIIVCGIPDLSISPFFVGKSHHQIAVISRADNTAIQYVARQMGVGFADVYSLTQKARKNPAQFLGSDDFHPSDQGHQAIANLVEPLMRQMLR